MEGCYARVYPGCLKRMRFKKRSTRPTSSSLVTMLTKWTRLETAVKWSSLASSAWFWWRAPRGKPDEPSTNLLTERRQWKDMTAQGENLVLQDTECMHGWDCVYYLCHKKKERGQNRPPLKKKDIYDLESMPGGVEEREIKKKASSGAFLVTSLSFSWDWIP